MGHGTNLVATAIILILLCVPVRKQDSAIGWDDKQPLQGSVALNKIERVSAARGGTDADIESISRIVDIVIDDDDIDDMIALMWVESGLRHWVISPTGDYGIAQVNKRWHPEYDYRMMLRPAYGMAAGYYLFTEVYNRCPNKYNGSTLHRARVDNIKKIM